MRNPYRNISRATLALGLAGWLAIGAGGPADAQGGWQAQWKAAVAAAGKEGVVNALVQPNRRFRAFVSKEWKKDFPKIKLSLTTMRGRQFLGKIRTERAAGKYVWDVAYTGSFTGYALYPKGVLDPLRPEFILPEVKDEKAWGSWKEAFYDNKGIYIISTQSYMKSPWYNTAMVSADKVRKLGLKILLDPSVKGKIIWHDPLIRGSGRTAALIFRKNLGDAAFKKLLTSQGVVFVANQNEMVDRMARGTGAIGIGPNLVKQTARYKKAGVKVDFELIGNTADRAELSTGGGALFVFNKRPHPNAARVFINWVLSKRIAEGIALVTGNNSRRNDVKLASPRHRSRIAGMKYIEPAREDMGKEMAAALKLVKKLRGK